MMFVRCDIEESSSNTRFSFIAAACSLHLSHISTMARETPVVIIALALLLVLATTAAAASSPSQELRLIKFGDEADNQAWLSATTIDLLAQSRVGFIDITVRSALSHTNSCPLAHG